MITAMRIAQTFVVDSNLDWLSYLCHTCYFRYRSVDYNRRYGNQDDLADPRDEGSLLQMLCLW